MADDIVSINTLDDLFATLVTQCSGLPANKVLIAYSEKGQISSAISDDVCYIHTEEESDYVDQYKNRIATFNSTTEKVTIAQRAMRVIKLQLTFYGPNSNVLGVKVKEKMYFDSVKQFLYKNNLAIIPEKDVIIKTHENINERWWDRVDVNIFFYNSVMVEEVANIIVDPVITITHDLEEQ